MGGITTGDIMADIMADTTVECIMEGIMVIVRRTNRFKRGGGPSFLMKNDDYIFFIILRLKYDVFIYKLQKVSEEFFNEKHWSCCGV